MNKKLKYVGKGLIREDSYDKASGKAKYVCDMEKHNMLHARLLLSEKAHAEIKIDKKQALKIPGIVAIYTYDDIPKIAYNSHQWYPGVSALEDEYILNDKARFVGDRIAIVVGETKESVNRALKEIKVEYNELSNVIGIESAEKDEMIIKGNTNLAFSKKLSCGNIDESFKKADFIIEDIGTTQKIHHAAMETHSCLAEKDEIGNIIVWMPCQVVFQEQYIIAKVLEMPYSKVRVIKSIMGGSFGGKGQPILGPICAFAAKELNRPVKLIMDRKDVIQGTRSRNASRIIVKTGITKDGKIVGREITANIDGGAYYTNAAAIALAMGKKSFRLYDIDSQIFTGNTYYTNTIPGGACRGYGSPQIHAVTELNIDNAARKIGMDTCEFRLNNVVSPNAEDPIGAPNLGNARIRECITKGMKRFNWYERKQLINNKNTDRYAYGIGMACATHGNGYHGAFPDFTNVDISILPSNVVWIKVGIHDQGCGTVQTMKQIAAEVLDIDPVSINIPQADTFISPYDSAGSQASRVTFVCGGAVKRAAEQIREKLINNFCKLNGCSKEKVILKDGYIYKENSSEKYTYGQIALETETNLEESLNVNMTYKSPANPAVYAVSFVEVKVDKYTGQVEVKDILEVHDIGQSINPVLVEGQIQGGAQMSIGMALCEEIEINKNGRVKSENFSKYHIINAPDMPEIKMELVEKCEPTGPFGAKSVGELVAVAPAPAILNAINNALDTNITVYPATPERIIEAITNKE